MRRDTIMQSLALLNKLWSGESHRVGRRTSESFELIGARLSMGLAVQPETVAAFMADSNGLARGTGFAARFLIAWPESTQGTRLYRGASGAWEGLAAYRDRLRSLLDLGLPPEPYVLELDPEAFDDWRHIHDVVELELREGGDLQDLRDVGSKTAENAARLAALFHLFERGPDGKVSADNMKRANAVALWHLSEARRFLGGMALPRALANAIKLDTWLILGCRQRGTERIQTREVMNRGPNPVRLKADLLGAMAELTDAHRARLEDDGRAIAINPNLLRVTA
jgi:putative DNA primase/helicase